MSARTAAAHRPPPRKRLDRAQVLEIARELSNEGGVDFLSITRLADKLGIRPPSVYAHFAGLTELRRELALRGFQLLTQRLSEAAVGLAGVDALMALGTAYLAFIRSEPGLYSATVPSPDVADVELRSAANATLAVIYRVLSGFGLTRHGQIHALRGIRSIVHGFGMLEAHGAFRTEVPRDSSFEQVLRTFVSAIGPQSAQGKAKPKARPPAKPRPAAKASAKARPARNGRATRNT
jgi:AcrR family transcriptional regulator